MRHPRCHHPRCHHRNATTATPPPQRHHPGEGRGPIGQVAVTARSPPLPSSPNWAPASAGVVNLTMFPREGGDPVWAPAFAGEQRAGTYDSSQEHHPGGGRGPVGKVAVTTRCAQLATSPTGPRPPPGTCGKFAVDTTTVSSPAPARCPTHPLSATTPGMARPCSIRPRASAAAPATGGISSVDRTLASVCTSYTSLSTRD